MSSLGRTTSTWPDEGAWLLAPAGAALLLLRPWFAQRPGAAALLAGTYIAIGVASVAAVHAGRAGWPRDDGSSSPLRVGAVLALGLAAFVVASASRPGLPATLGTVGLALTVLASVAEEAFFRGFLYGRLQRFGVPVAIVGAAVAFALIHVPGYPHTAIWIDLAAGLLFGWQRWATGSWLVPAATHLLANLLVVMT
jgi:membrane protease YdiL (CAAX protease family)